MMDPTVANLISSAIDTIRLKILVFGPDVAKPSSEPRTRDLQAKRQEIRAALEHLGHTVKYAEELIDPTLTGPTANPFFQELVIMAEYDLIVTLAGSPGSNAETGAIAARTKLAQKAALYLDEEFIGGLVGHACLHAQNIGAYFQTYKYPDDLTECHLLSSVLSRVDSVRLAKFLV